MPIIAKQPRGPKSDALEKDDDFSPNHLHPYVLIPLALFTYPDLSDGAKLLFAHRKFPSRLLRNGESRKS
jgi:hypothetical protein